MIKGKFQKIKVEMSVSTIGYQSLGISASYLLLTNCQILLCNMAFHYFNQNSTIPTGYMEDIEQKYVILTDPINVLLSWDLFTWIATPCSNDTSIMTCWIIIYENETLTIVMQLTTDNVVNNSSTNNHQVHFLVSGYSFPKWRAITNNSMIQNLYF